MKHKQEFPHTQWNQSSAIPILNFKVNGKMKKKKKNTRNYSKKKDSGVFFFYIHSYTVQCTVKYAINK